MKDFKQWIKEQKEKRSKIKMQKLGYKKEIKALLCAVNSPPNIDKYILGNDKLTQMLKYFEQKNLIQFNKYNMQWEIIKHETNN